MNVIFVGPVREERDEEEEWLPIYKQVRMKALWTKANSLQWEVNRPDAENCKLRADHPAASERVNLEAELEQSQSNVTQVTSRVREYEKQQRASSKDRDESAEG